MNLWIVKSIKETYFKIYRNCLPFNYLNSPNVEHADGQTICNPFAHVCDVEPYYYLYYHIEYTNPTLTLTSSHHNVHGITKPICIYLNSLRLFYFLIY